MVIIHQMNNDCGMERQVPTSVTSTITTSTEAMVEFMVCNYTYLQLKNQTNCPFVRPLYRSSCVSRHLQVRTGGFCWCIVLLPTCHCWHVPLLKLNQNRNTCGNTCVPVHTLSSVCCLFVSTLSLEPADLYLDFCMCIFLMFAYM